MNNALFSSSRDDWETPPDFFRKLDEEFHFDLDPCALPATAKCPRFFTPEDDGLNRPWVEPGGCYILQSAVFTAEQGQSGSRGMDQKSRRGGRKARGGGGAPHSSQNGHRRLSRLHLPPGRNPLCPWPPPLSRGRQRGGGCPVSEYGRHIPRPSLERGIVTW